MSDYEAPFGADQESILAGHQPDKVNMPAILIFGFALVVVTAFTFLILGFMMGLFGQADASRQALVSPLFESNEGLYPAPRLQASPPRDMRAYRREIDTLVNSYGWVDQKADLARVPIPRAIELSLSKDGLFPSRKSALDLAIDPRGDQPAAEQPAASPSNEDPQSPAVGDQPATTNGESPK